ncbi:uncharacterized protein LOC118185645 isoform X2 [Stegodyphus dumicola]|uniref:uncharacterized protein LOC118185645 isoform X2 n=1 Tax=Stegodyphus dumicola TaxID=202533 RepID=UPI0015A91E8B|nr:uncharacterized protein LOC118185645 isoform X2 [Stegodyphus dumicola]
MLEWIIFASLLRGAVSLRLVSMEVPEKVARGQGTRLTCGYDLEGDVLYSIKWYKDEVEFFRYVPTDRPPGQFFPLKGIQVDLGRSSNGSVYIRNVSRSTAGIYKCEVSADAPSFQTVSAEKPMAVEESSGQAQYEADRSTASFLIVTMLLILQWRYHMW